MNFFQFTFIPSLSFKQNYSIVGSFLTQYLEYLKRWEANRGHSMKLKPSIDWAEFHVSQKRNIIEISMLIKNFSFFKTLNENDQTTILKHFEIPFVLFERAYYSFNTANNSNFVYLFNGDFVDLNNVKSYNSSNVTSEVKKARKAFISYWKTIMNELRDLDPHVIEAVYIFFSLLWNIQYMEKSLSAEGDAVVRRGRFLLHAEMKKFYGNDRIKCQRLFHLQDICQIIENGADACKILQ